MWSTLNVECVVWWLMWVVFVVTVLVAVWCCENCPAWFVLMNVGFVERSAF